MNIYDRTSEFANALSECEEVKNLRESSKNVKADEKAVQMVKDFRKVQMEAYTEQMNNNGKLSKEMQDKFQNLISVISLNPVVGRYLKDEQAFGTMWQDIMKTINDAIDVDLELGFTK